MDRTHFGLRHRPFRNTPDTEFYYPATTHEVALAELHSALEGDDGFALVTGAPGSGKTLLLHRLLETLGPAYRSVFLTNTHWAGCADLLQAILFDLSLPYQGRSEQELRLAVTEACLSHFDRGGNTVLVVDEAQHLTPGHFEELRLLSNLESRHGKAVQVVFAGLPELTARLEQPALAAVRQRLAARAQLQPLSFEESADYLLHHLRLAGGRPERLFAEDAVEFIARAAQGIPRLLNQAASGAMHLAASAGATVVDAEAALEAIARLGLEAEGPVDELPATRDAAAAEPADEEPPAAGPAALPEAPLPLLAPGERPPVLIFDGADPELAEAEAKLLAGRALARTGLSTRVG